MSMGPPGRH